MPGLSLGLGLGLNRNKGGGVQDRQWLIGGYAVKIGPYNILFS